MRESTFQADAIKDLREKFNCECHKLGQEGNPDWLIVYAPERCLYMEFKTDVGDLTKAQRVRFRDLIERGHTIILARDYETAIMAVKVAQRGSVLHSKTVPLHLLAPRASQG